MPSAPAVQNLQDLVSQYTTAEAPQQSQINNQITQNDASGATQIQGLNTAENTAFQGIDQKANDNGMYFSGFRPDQQAQYVGGTYLPALAKLQDTIASTRNTLLGQQAKLQSDANTGALTEQQNQQKALDAWNTQQEAEAAAVQDTNSKNANALQVEQVRANASNAPVNPTVKLQTDQAAMGSSLAKVAGGDGYVSPGSYNAAKNAWTAEGYNPATFDASFGQFRNPKNPYYR